MSLPPRQRIATAVARIDPKGSGDPVGKASTPTHWRLPPGAKDAPTGSIAVRWLPHGGRPWSEGSAETH
jgi:hypothetical protein